MADPNEPVRVRCEDTGHEYTIRRVSLPHGNYKLLRDQKAADPNTGRFLPPKFAAPDKGQSAIIKKESGND